MILFLRKRLVLNLLEFRFLGAMALVLLLFGLVSFNHKRVYQRERANLNDEQLAWQAELSHAHAYSQVLLVMLRQPTPLGILVASVGNRYGSIARLGGRFTVDLQDDPRTQKILTLAQANPFLAGLLDLDFSRLVLFFFSLLAIFLTYDAICGERERGLLKLCLSYSVPRYRLLFGEFAGNLITLASPLVVMMLLWLVILRLPPSVPLRATDYGRLAVILSYTVLFLSGFILLGLWVSALTRSQTTSLAVLLVIWIGTVIVYPESVPLLARRWGPDENSMVSTVFQPWTPQRGEEAWRQRVQQALLAERLKVPIPTTAYVQAVEAMAQTDIGGHIRFVDQARLWNERFRSWQQAKLRQYPGRDFRFEPSPLDVSGLPGARYEPEDMSHSLIRTLPDIMTLSLFNVVCCLGALRALVNYIPTE